MSTDVDSGKSNKGEEEDVQGKGIKQFFKATTSDVLHLGKKKLSEAKDLIAGKKEEVILISPQDGVEVTKKLQRLFQDVKDMPIAIYSIAGPYRKGKSFLMNFFFQSLVHSEAKNSYFPPNYDFDQLEWGGGMDPTTKGILIHSKHFIRKDKEGDEVAVFLMDTQGLFDHTASMTKCSSIFALSTLISSMQIYNLSQQIQEDNLQYLQLFTDYAKQLQFIRGSGPTYKPFQNLLFLVRDWQHTSIAFGSKGGEKALEKALAFDENSSEDVKSVRTHIKNSFENVSCFLLPYPGRKTAERDDDNHKWQLSDLKPNFKNYADALAKHLFSPTNLAVKIIAEEKVTGEYMINFISSALEHFSSEKVPQIKTVFENVTEQIATKTLEDCDEICQEKWQEYNDPNKYLEEEELSSIASSIETLVLEKFDKHVLLGNHDFKIKLKKALKERMKQQALPFKQENSNKRETEKQKFEDGVKSAAEDYGEKLAQHLESMRVEVLNSEKLQKYHKQLSDEILKNFDQNHVGAMRQKYRDRLNDEIQRQFYEKSHKTHLEQVAIKESMKKLVHECYEVLRKILPEEVVVEGDHGRYVDIFQEAKQEAQNKFDEVSRKYDPGFVEPYRKELKNKLQQYDDRNKVLSDADVEKQQILWQENVKKAKDAYDKNLIKPHEYLTADELANLHEESMKKAVETFQPSEGSNQNEKQQRELFDSQLCEFFEYQLKFLQLQNEEAKANIVLEFQQAISKGLKQYNREVPEVVINDIQEGELEKVHLRALSEVKENFDKTCNSKNLEDVKQQYWEELKESIEKQYNRISLNLSRKMKRISESISAFSSKCLQTYIQYMSKNLLSPVTEDRFEQIHSFALHRALNKFDIDLVVSTESLKQEERDQLLSLIETEKMRLFQANQDKMAMEKQLSSKNLKDAADLYQSTMEEKSSKGYVETSKLMHYHRTIRQQALDQFEGEAEKQQLHDHKTLEADLMKTIESVWNIIFSENMLNKKQEEYKIKEQATNLLNMYAQELQEKLQAFVENHELLMFYTDLKNKTLNMFDECKSENLVEYFELEKERLTQNIKEEYEHAVHANNSKKRDLGIQLKRQVNMAEKHFEEAFDDLNKKWFEEEELDDRINKEKQRAISAFKGNVEGIPASLLEESFKTFEENIDMSALKIKNENSTNQEFMQIYAEYAKKEAITHMRFENLQVLNDQIGIEIAVERASDAISESMNIFEEGLKKCSKKFNTYKYKQNLRAHLDQLTQSLIQQVKDQQIEIQTYGHEAKRMAIEHMKKVERIADEDLTNKAKQEWISEIKTESKERFKHHIKSCRWRIYSDEYECETDAHINNIFERVQRKAAIKCGQKAQNEAVTLMKNEVEKIQITTVEETNVKLSEKLSISMEKFHQNIQSNYWKIPNPQPQPFERETKLELDKIKADYMLGVRKKDKEMRVANLIVELKVEYATKVSEAVKRRSLKSGKKSELDRLNEELVAEYKLKLKNESNDEIDELRLLDALNREYKTQMKEIEEGCVVL